METYRYSVHNVYSMLHGNIIHGDGLGRKYGYPTANVDCKKPVGIYIHPGIYAGWAQIDDQKYPSAIAIKENPWKVEAYLLDVSDLDLYGKYMELDLIARVSEYERYDTVEELIKKIHADVVLVKGVFDSL